MRNLCYTQSFPLEFDEFKPIIAWWENRRTTDSAWYVRAKEVREGSFTLDFRNPSRSSSIGEEISGVKNKLGTPLKAALEQVEALHQELEELSNNSLELSRSTPL